MNPRAGRRPPGPLPPWRHRARAPARRTRASPAGCRIQIRQVQPPVRKSPRRRDSAASAAVTTHPGPQYPAPSPPPAGGASAERPAAPADCRRATPGHRPPQAATQPTSLSGTHPPAGRSPRGCETARSSRQQSSPWRSAYVAGTAAAASPRSDTGQRDL